MSLEKVFPAAGRILSGLASLALFALPAVGYSMGAKPMHVEMAADQWQADNGQLSFIRKAGDPLGLMKVKGGGAVLKNVAFTNGTIEYDINEDDDPDETSGIWFHRQNADVAENFYLRPFEDCASTKECEQYAPVSHGNVQWDSYPEYEAAAPVKLKGWNHVKLVISGKRMNVFVNRESRPSLVVGALAGDVSTGGIELLGDATYANLTITPEAVEELSPEAVTDPTAADPRYLRHWLLSPVSTLPRGHAPSFAAMPSASQRWKHLDAERKGYVDISRRHGTQQGVPDLAWLKTSIESDRAQRKHVSIGWLCQIWIYVNGKQVFAENNQYYPASLRKTPMGRLSIENGSFSLPLRKGKNEIVIATSNDLGHTHHWGWGFEFRLADLAGVHLQAQPGSL